MIPKADYYLEKREKEGGLLRGKYNIFFLIILSTYGSKLRFENIIIIYYRIRIFIQNIYLF